mmetsp:Transcript_11908/g.16142  ORF Transcript_11908/g.16142 Transcript_11908/m.16142 type:complete len:346 (+) Transcript_11908:25-1062(+)
MTLRFNFKCVFVMAFLGIQNGFDFILANFVQSRFAEAAAYTSNNPESTPLNVNVNKNIGRHLAAEIETKWDRFLWKTAEDIQPFYAKYSDELNHVRALGDAWCTNDTKIACISTFVEMEILYMRLRETQPKVVIEACPNSGWSTFWILHALKANGHGHSHSFDKSAKPIKAGHVIADSPSVKWTHHQGDIMETFPSQLTEEELNDVDYVFIDMSHFKPLTLWYVENIFGYFTRRTYAQDKVILVGVHDVYNHWYPLCKAAPDSSDPSVEGLVVYQWIVENANFVRSAFEWSKFRHQGSRIKELIEVRQKVTGKDCDAGVHGIMNMRNWCDVLTLYFNLHVPSKSY